MVLRTLAAIALGIVTFGCGQAGEPPEDRSDLRALVIAFGGRPLEPRLTGGFAYTSCAQGPEAGRLLSEPRCTRLPYEGTPHFRELARIASKIEARARIHSTPQALHAAGIALLVVASAGETPSPSALPRRSRPSQGAGAAPLPETEYWTGLSRKRSTCSRRRQPKRRARHQPGPTSRRLTCGERRHGTTLTSSYQRCRQPIEPLPRMVP